MSSDPQHHVSDYLKPGATLDDAVALARKWHQDGNMAHARAMYEYVREQSPDHVDALNFGGVLAFQMGDRDEGLALVRESITKKPDYPDAHANIGLMLHTMGELDAAEAHLARAIELDPVAISPRLTLANSRRRQGRTLEALEMLEKLREESPRNPLVRHSLSALLRAIGKPEQAKAELQVAYDTSDLNTIRARIASMFAHDGHLEEAQAQIREMIALDPESRTLRHQLAAYGGIPAPERTGDELVTQIFDVFAPDFDLKLARLDYRAPELVGGLLRRLLGPDAAPVDLLDAGCGTGLLGLQVRDLARNLDGVDLSDGMLEKARERKLYDQLIVGELTAFLDEHPDRYDVVASVDTLCYFGALDGVAKSAFTCVRPGGWLIFSVEDGLDQEQEHFLHVGGRYAHRRDHVEKALRAAGFEAPTIEHGNLRSEMRKPVPGLICAARKGR